MGDPFIENGIRRSIDFVQVTIRAPAHVPVMIQTAPAGTVAVRRVIGTFCIRGIEGPGVDEIPEHVAFHGHVGAGGRRCAHHQRL